jgi:hypothetical protein
VNAPTATCGWRDVRLHRKPRNWLVPVDLQRLRVASLRHKGEPGQHHPSPAGVIPGCREISPENVWRRTNENGIGFLFQYSQGFS